MSSISSITKQYAKQQQMKKAQKGGAMFDFLKGDDDSNKEEASAETSSTVGSQSTEEKGPIDKLKETLGFGTTTTPTEPLPATEPVVPDTNSEVKNEEESKENPGLLSGIFGTGETKKEDASEGEASESEASDDESDDGSEASEGESEASDDGSESESDASESDGSDASESEDNDDDFEMISQKMNTLREKYEKLKSDHNAIKNKMESEKAEQKKMNDAKVSTLIAAFTASQGALTAFKEALVEHLKNNNYPLDGLQLDASSFNAAPAPAPAPAPAEVAVEPEQPAPAPAPAPVEEVAQPEQLAPAPVVPAENVAQPEQLNTEPVNGNMDTSMLESGSESEESQDSENEGEQAESSALPEIPVNEVSENNTVDNTATEPASEPASAAGEPTSINGGRSHYVHSTNKKAATHRHHKRRNRHQTLRGYKK